MGKKTLIGVVDCIWGCKPKPAKISESPLLGWKACMMAIFGRNQ